MMGFIALLIVACCLFWAVFGLYTFYRLCGENKRRVARSKREFEALAHEQQAIEERRGSRRRKIASCDPERISAPVSVKHYIDNSRLERYEDGSEAYYDGFGNLVYFRADPELNADR